MGPYITAFLGSWKGSLLQEVWGEGGLGNGGRGHKTAEHLGLFLRTKALSRKDNRCLAIDGFVLFGLLTRK
jgi:hypothetical protein